MLFSPNPASPDVREINFRGCFNAHIHSYFGDASAIPENRVFLFFFYAENACLIGWFNLTAVQRCRIPFALYASTGN